MEERRVAAIPHVNVVGVTGPKEYGIMLTDQRSIFVLLKKQSATGYLLGGAVGWALASSMAEDRHVDFDNTAPETLATVPDSIIVPHNAIHFIRFKKSMGIYQLQIKYRDSRSKKKSLNAYVAPTAEYFKKKKAEGVKRKEAHKQYFTNVENAYRKALPLTVAVKTKWSE